MPITFEHSYLMNNLKIAQSELSGVCFQNYLDFFLFNYLFWAVLHLHSCTSFSGCGEWWLLSSSGARASPCSGFSCCGAQLEDSVVAARRLNSCGMWDLPVSGLEPTSSALAGRFFTTEPPGSPEIT